jgi:hypothetical protein
MRVLKTARTLRQMDATLRTTSAERTAGVDATVRATRSKARSGCADQEPRFVGLPSELSFSWCFRFVSVVPPT